jgi:hypothetical protein
MDRTFWQLSLERVERDVALGRRLIARQTEIVAELERNGSDTQAALDLLAQFEASQALHIAHRDRLRRELNP